MPPMPSAAPPPSAAANSTTNTVAIKDFAFAPASTTVKKGTTVTWTNQDQDAHTVTSTGSGGPLRSPTLQTGQSYQYTFTTPGTFEYLCTIHPFMTATVTVTP
ncbi:cupredoxin domain-containing protein [Amycolatopsis sp. SID8362]|uniref:cupredoxin domain-containing protein n=1 Tax=Amycolatopsis sp. SID8362 TaxID=2690346 RepID=UPI002814C63D|nr:cupredoxin domain-containing protein [Amycolatopsis sp. SID8362]